MVINDTLNSPHVPKCPPADRLFDELISKRRNHDSTVSAAICVELVSYFRKVAPVIFDTVETHLNTASPQLIYTPSRLKADLDEHLDLLCALVPPIEYRDTSGIHAADLATILNVGWAALLTRIDQVPESSGHIGDRIAGKMERLHELLLKAVELSEARLLWEENR